MKHNWEYKRLGDVCEIVMGQSPESSSYNSDGDGIPFFQGSSDFGEYYPEITTYCNAPSRLAEYNDILFSVRAPIGSMNFSPTKVCIGRGLASIRAMSPNSQKYIYYILGHTNRSLNEKGTGSTFKAITKVILHDHNIPIPPKETQERIVAELDDINAMIDAKREQLKQLDLLAQSVFYTMFGDPVTNPKGWEIKKVGNISSVLTGSTPSREIERYYIGNIPWVKTTEVQNCRISDTEEHISEEALADTNCKIFPINTILVAMYGQGKTRGQVARLDIEACTNQACAAILPNDILIPSFIFNFLLVSYEPLRSVAVGCNQKNLNLSLIKNYPIICPPLALQQQFAAKVEAIEAQKAEIEETIKELQPLLDSRMDYWFN
ncbi:MAG: restriction endonuclease subunit S [Muribaculum sp.]|nr:restriction endonuclease subunit S [Muribaculum sp.]